jgi:exopolyphosphatase/guanosine-5'-triphosphate,3'-diphosphate pyrophosphatase
MEGLTLSEARTVRKLATLLRVADALDRSHAQPISKLRADLVNSKVMIRLSTHGPADLELWDVAHEAQLFRKVFGKSLAVTTVVSRRERAPVRKNRNRIVT